MVSVHWIQKGSNLMPSHTKIFLETEWKNLQTICARVNTWVERPRSSHQPSVIDCSLTVIYRYDATSSWNNPQYGSSVSPLNPHTSTPTILIPKMLKLIIAEIENLISSHFEKLSPTQGSMDRTTDSWAERTIFGDPCSCPMRSVSWSC